MFNPALRQALYQPQRCHRARAASETHCRPLCCSGFANLAVGLRPDVDVFEGAAAEFVLGLLLAFLVSYSAELGSGCVGWLKSAMSGGSRGRRKGT